MYCFLCFGLLEGADRCKLLSGQGPQATVQQWAPGHGGAAAATGRRSHLKAMCSDAAEKKVLLSLWAAARASQSSRLAVKRAD